MAEETKKAEAAAEEAAEETAAEVTAEEETEEKTPLQIKEEELSAANDKYLRLAAEYDNFRKRTQREKEALFGDATASAVSAFLAVYDNMERAVTSPCTDEGYKKGVELIFTELENTLKKLNVETISPAGEKFDPNFHSAVMHEDNPDFEENTVSEVFQKGFKLGERVVRPAIVKVAN